MMGIRKSLIVLLLFTVVSSYGQKTAIYTDAYRAYNEGQDLYDKEKYSAAQDKFEEVVKQIENNQDEIRINSEYYFAICALELFHKDAEFLLNRFVTEHPDHPKGKSVFFQLGKHNYRLKKSKKVIEYLTKVDPYDLSEDERIEYYFKLGYSYFKQKDFVLAKGNFYEILDKDTEYKAPAVYYYSHIAYSDKNFQTALEGFQTISCESMFKSIAPYYITQIYYKQEKYKKVIEYAPVYMDSVSSKRKSEFAKLIGDAYYYEKKYSDAIPYLMEFRNGVKATRVDNYQIGFAYYGTKNYESAVKFLAKASTKKDALSQTAYYHMAESYLKLEEKDYASNAFRAASKLDFNSEITESSLFNYAKLAYELSYNPYDEAIEAFHEYIEIYPNSPQVEEAYEFLIRVYMTTKNYEDALASLDRVKNKDDRMKVAYQTVSFNRAVQLFHNGEFDKALTRFKDVKRYPVDKKMNAESLFWIAECKYNKGELDDAISQYSEFRMEPGAALTSVFHQADYNIGYAYFLKSNPFTFNRKKTITSIERSSHLNSSITAFRNFVLLEETVKNKPLIDAFLRLADCYFLLSDDVKAIEYYNKVIEKGEGDLSYAYFKKATSQGYIEDQEGKAKTLQELTERYPNSSYQILSIRELADTYKAQGEHQKAIDTYEQFIRDYPQNKYVPRAIVNVGSVYLSTQEYDKAEKYLEKVLFEYPNATSENESAVLLMKDIYKGRDDLSGYYDWLVEQGREIAQSELDSVFWEPVQDAWDRGDCANIILKGKEYNLKVENGKHQADAHYYIARCIHQEEKLEEALSHYNSVIDKVNNNHYENALKYAGNISYFLSDYRQAIGHYSTLERVAASEENIRTSVIGQMRGFWNLNNYQSAIDYSNKVLILSNLDEPLEIEASLINGLSLKETDRLDEAYEILITLSENTKSIKGAEAKYNAAEILFEQEKNDECEITIMELVKQKPTYDYWIAKAIILLGDNFIVKEDYFNAKSSLQSVIDNYDGKDKAEIVLLAQSKIDYILELESQSEKSIEKEDVEIDFEGLDEKDKKLFEDELEEEKEKQSKEPNN